MKVCHITSVHKSTDGRIFYKECCSLVKLGYNVYLVAPGQSLESDGVHIVGIGDKPKSRVKRILKYSYRAYKTALNLDADLYHLHDPELLPYALLLKKHGKKVIFDSHENYAMQISIKPYLNKFLQVSLSKIYSFIESFITKKIDAVIIPCTFEGKNIFENRARKTLLLPNYVSKNFYEKNYEFKVDKFNTNQEYFCYIGSLTRERGITQLVIAAKKAKRKLILAGAFTDEFYKKEIIAMMDMYIEYIGVITESEVKIVLSNSRIGMATLLKTGQYGKADTLGVKVFEYMGMGVPVILSDTEYNNRFMEKYDVGCCVDPENIALMSDKINFIFDNPKQAKIMGENGRKAVKEEFNWSTQEKKLVDLYESMSKIM